MAEMNSDDLAKAEVSINTEANSGKSVELPRHNYFTANGYRTFLLTTPGGGNNELVVSMANKVYKVPAILFASLTVLEYLNILAAGIGGVNVLHAKNVAGEAVTGLTRLSRVSCGSQVYQVRKYLDGGYQALHANILNLITSGVNIYDLENGSTALSRVQTITSEMAALTDMLASVSKIADPTPITHIVQYLVSQMFTCDIVVDGTVVTVSYDTEGFSWDSQVYAAHVDPAILLLCAEDQWYKTQNGARTSPARFMSDGSITSVVINMCGHQVARYDRQEGDASVADVYRRIIQEQATSPYTTAVAQGVEDKLGSLVNTLDVNCFYPVDIPTIEQGADTSMIGRGQGSCDPCKDTMIHYDSKSTIILPKVGSHKDVYPQLAANHRAIEGMAFAHAEGAVDRATIAEAQMPLTATAVYSKWSVAIRDADDKSTESFYTLTPAKAPDASLDKEFSLSALYHAILVSCAGEIFIKDHDGSLELPAVIMGSCCSQDTSGCLQLQLQDGQKLTMRPSACNVILKYGNTVLDHAPDNVPDGFSPLPLSSTDETEHHCSPVYANLDDFIVDLVLTDVNGAVITEGSFNLKAWPRLALNDIRGYQKLLAGQIKTASSDQAAGNAKIEEGSQIPRNWFEDLLSWFKDLLSSKWLWVIIAIIVVIILTRKSGGSGSSTTIVLGGVATPSADRNVFKVADNTQKQPTQSDDLSALDLI